MLEWYNYDPVSLAESPADLRASLPSSIRSELIDDPAVFRHLIAADASKEAVVAYLDSVLLHSSPPSWMKSRQVEASRKEIPQFSYFRICPQRLDLGKDLRARLTAPQCTVCSWGVTFSGPIDLDDKLFGSLSFGEIMRTHRLDIELVVSSEIQRVFTDAEITGLEIEPIEGTDFGLARIGSTYWRQANAILTGVACRKHRLVVAPTLLNPSTPVDAFQEDFVTIRGVRVAGVEYLQHPPEWFVSQRVVKLLLEHATRLERATIRLNEKFKPCLAHC